MANECNFEEIHLENLGYCPNAETVGGTKTTMFYIPMAQLEKFEKPTVTNESTYAERITIGEDGIEAMDGKGFKSIDLMIDESELKSALVGNKGNKKPQGSLEALIPNFTDSNIGFIDTHKNTPMLFVILDSTGKKWALPDSFFETADGTTGKTYEDNSGVTLNIIANSKLYVYEGEIEVLPDDDEETEG